MSDYPRNEFIVEDKDNKKDTKDSIETIDVSDRDKRKIVEETIGFNFLLFFIS